MARFYEKIDSFVKELIAGGIQKKKPAPAPIPDLGRCEVCGRTFDELFLKTEKSLAFQGCSLACSHNSRCLENRSLSGERPGQV
jgi:hypothetical protein